MHGIKCLPAFLPTHLNVKAGYPREGWFQSDTFLIADKSLNLGVNWRWIYCHENNYILENPLPLGTVGLNACNDPNTFSYVFPPPALVPLVLVKFLAEHVTGWFRHLILVAHHWMEATWLPIVLNLLLGITHCCPVVQNLVMDVSLDQVLKGLPSLQLILAAQRCVLCRKGFSSFCRAVTEATQVSITKIRSDTKRNGSVGVLQTVYRMMPFCP